MLMNALDEMMGGMLMDDDGLDLLGEMLMNGRNDMMDNLLDKMKMTMMDDDGLDLLGVLLDMPSLKMAMTALPAAEMRMVADILLDPLDLLDKLMPGEMMMGQADPLDVMATTGVQG